MPLPKPSAWLCVAADGSCTATTSEAERNALALCGRKIEPLYTDAQLSQKDHQDNVLCLVAAFEGKWPGAEPDGSVRYFGSHITRAEFDSVASDQGYDAGQTGLRQRKTRNG